MANVDRAFRVIVLGGIALASVPAGACGGSIAASNDAGASDSGSFPDEGCNCDTGFPQEGADTGFPTETAMFVDTGIEPDAFPTEGPAMILDSGMAEAAVDGGEAGFPQETAQAGDP
jgi:hypothetical protein